MPRWASGSHLYASREVLHCLRPRMLPRSTPLTYRHRDPLLLLLPPLPRHSAAAHSPPPADRDHRGWALPGGEVGSGGRCQLTLAHGHSSPHLMTHPHDGGVALTTFDRPRCGGVFDQSTRSHHNVRLSKLQPNSGQTNAACTIPACHSARATTSCECHDGGDRRDDHPPSLPRHRPSSPCRGPLHKVCHCTWMP